MQSSFNTSHVTLYPLRHPQWSQQSEFQYISCYSLSSSSSSPDSCSVRFNTSHVTLYRVIVNNSPSFCLFQYISCYSLSHVQGRRVPGRTVSIHLMLLFIILRRLFWQMIDCVSIHLMLLFISSSTVHSDTALLFQYISCYSLSTQVVHNALEVIPFQYISCYSLSPVYFQDWWCICQFQYISCYSLSRSRYITGKRRIKFQYISCYSLSVYGR